MRIDQFAFASIRIDGVIYEHDVVIARGRVGMGRVNFTDTTYRASL